uniref:Uncharacterized protein n=1 Tax=Arundo donax TaxID=35708 RepID=A0A0A9EWT6_ARUDO
MDRRASRSSSSAPSRRRLNSSSMKRREGEAGSRGPGPLYRRRRRRRQRRQLPCSPCRPASAPPACSTPRGCSFRRPWEVLECRTNRFWLKLQPKQAILHSECSSTWNNHLSQQLQHRLMLHNI